ncbi:MAG: phosphoglycerate mutase (2,3-diphosphoglycerate-independent) [Oscillibacter sp.]|nr:phosphoglycerate mutase (2,3-diphosphoglycerate-independent) [Oscillibacter sp.]
MSEMKRGGRQLAGAVKAAYERGLDDYHMEPMLLVEDGAPVGKIADHDAVVFCCRRGEREIELTELFTEDGFDKVERRKLDDLYFVIMTMYHDKFKHLPIAFAPSQVEKPLAQLLSEAGKRQLHCAESEKFAHVTFFFNGGENRPFPGEDDICIPSPKGIDFDRKPELSLPEVADTVVDALGKYDFIVTNFANGDVIGHTRNTEAKLAACGHVSRHLEQVVSAALEKEYVVAITADHGNIEKLYTKEGKPDGAHTTNPVPFILIDPKAGAPISLRQGGTLGDVAPTVLDIMNIPQPAEMGGTSLAVGHDWGESRKALLIICDGWGIGSGDEGDAIHMADTPYWDCLLAERCWCTLQASGSAVGLGAGKAGNSEAGHTNLGAGRCVMQDDVRLDAAVADGSFKENPVFLSAIQHARERGSALHLLAYLTYKSSHGCIDYPLSICEMAKAAGLEQVYFHIIFDGRSTEPGSAPALLAELEEKLETIGLGRIVDGVGRGVVLDRDKNYDKVKRAYDAMVDGAGIQYS